MTNKSNMKTSYWIILTVELLLMAVLVVRHFNITDIVLLVLCISAAYSTGVAATYIFIKGDEDAEQ